MSDLSDETQELLARGRSGVNLPPERRATIRARVMGTVAGAAVLTTAAGSAAAAAGSGTTAGAALKLVGMAAVTLALGGGTAVAIHRTWMAPPSPASTSAVAFASDRAAPAASGRAHAAGRSVEDVAPVVTAAVVDSVAPREETPANTPAPPRTALRADSAPVTIERRSPTEVRPGAGNTAPRASSFGDRASPTAAPDSSSSSSAFPILEPIPPPASYLKAEASLLQSAHRALSDGDGVTALRLLDEHAARFPRGALEPERSAERVFALCQQHRQDEALRAARTFLMEHPDGPLASRVRGSCMMGAAGR